MSEIPGSDAPRCSPPPPRLPGPCSGEPQLQAAAGVQREGEKQQFPLCVRVSARLPARRLPAARSLRSLRALTGFLARSSLMSRRGKRRGLNAPEIGAAEGGERLPVCSTWWEERGSHVLPPWGPWGPACSWGSPAGPSTPLPPLLSPEGRVPRQAPRQPRCLARPPLDAGVPRPSVPSIVTQAWSKGCAPGGHS